MLWQLLVQAHDVTSSFEMMTKDQESEESRRRRVEVMNSSCIRTLVKRFGVWMGRQWNQMLAKRDRRGEKLFFAHKLS